MLSLSDVVRNAKRHLAAEHLITIEPRSDRSAYRWLAMGGIRGVRPTETLATLDALADSASGIDACDKCGEWHLAIEASETRDASANGAEVRNA